MADCMKSASEALHQILVEGLGRLVGEGKLPAEPIPAFRVEIPADKSHGDFAANVAMVSAKTFRMAPRKIAELLLEAISLNGTIFARAEIAGPGFMNFFLQQKWFADVTETVLTEKENYGKTQTGAGKRALVEFVSANPTGPMHVGNARGGALGDSLAEILAWTGWDVQREFYVNDAGNQINNLAASVNARYLEELGVDVEFPENGYHGYDIVETAKRIVKIYGDKFLHMDEEERLHEFRTIALKEKLAALKEDLEAFNVTFDVWFSEQTLHDANKIREACELLTERGYMYEKDGALWLKATAYGDDKDRVVIRDNGVPTYLAADIAYHWNKFSRGFDRVINLWGADHHGYIARMKAAVGALGYDPEQLEVLILQMVSLYRNGELVKMSKRTGQSVTLNELIEEVGTDAARFFFAMRSIDSQLDFDLTLATEKSNENPVYYIQYAHARICSIMRQLAEENIAEAATADYTLLTDATELELIKKLGEYEEMLELAAQERAVHRVAHYVHDLAGLFHSFYNQCRILGVDPEVQQARIKLVKAARHTIKHALGILGVSAPERM